MRELAPKLLQTKDPTLAPGGLCRLVEAEIAARDDIRVPGSYRYVRADELLDCPTAVSPTPASANGSTRCWPFGD
jgi:hypothetical protein